MDIRYLHLVTEHWFKTWFRVFNSANIFSESQQEIEYQVFERFI